MLAAHMQGFATGHQQLESGVPRQQLHYRWGAGCHLLEVVEDQHEALVPQPAYEALKQRLTAGLAYPDGERDVREHSRGVAVRGQIDEEHPVVEPVDQL